MHIFGKLAHIFGKLVHIFARKLVSGTSKQVLRNLGQLWQPGIYNDTNFVSKETKGQQPNGKIVSALLHTFEHFSAHFHTFFRVFQSLFSRTFLELRGFTTVLFQRDEKILKENKKKKTKPFCTLVVGHLSFSDFSFYLARQK